MGYGNKPKLGEITDYIHQKDSKLWKGDPMECFNVMSEFVAQIDDSSHD